MNNDISLLINFAEKQNSILHQICFELTGKSTYFSELKPELGSFVNYLCKMLLNLETIDTKKEFKQINNKLLNTKKRWYKQVISYYESRNSSKYILNDELKLKSLLELDFLSDKSKIENQIKNLYNEKVKLLDTWFESMLLHEFPYIDDLQVNQRKLILELDSLYLLLEELQESKDILNVAIKLEYEITGNKEKSYGGQIPDSLVSVDGIFRVSKPKDEQVHMFEDEIAFTSETTDMKYTLSAPMVFKDQESDLTIDYSSERNYLTAYEQRVLVAILQLGRKQIQTTNKIRFSKNQVLELLSLSSGGKNYALIEKYLFNLMNLRHRVEYKNQFGESRILTFVILQSIDRPKEEDKDDQGHKEWTVTLNSDLHNQILERNFVDVFAEELRELKSETAMVLLPFLASERLKSFRRVTVRGKETYNGLKLIEKAGLSNNKPSKLLNKVVDALEEFKHKGICIQSFKVKGVGKSSKIIMNFLEN